MRLNAGLPSGRGAAEDGVEYPADTSETTTTTINMTLVSRSALELWIVTGGRDGMLRACWKWLRWPE